ncbi:hypothetical protein Vadar_026731 [Vaccinium darrowii]|uniref:Uncharacterized protein n=1 Tax=Vaccinium darrowii TaxID=229202 RepID=A0ACB7YIE5_9ERIC|nr:hypothetical protein Vadar_026731 [Vaccinium darrowii]
MDLDSNFPVLGSAMALRNHSSFTGSVSGPASKVNPVVSENFFDRLERITVANTDHLAIDETDGPATCQIKSLSAEVQYLRKQLDAQNSGATGSILGHKGADPVVPPPPSWTEVVSQSKHGARQKLTYHLPQIKDAKCPSKIAAKPQTGTTWVRKAVVGDEDGVVPPPDDHVMMVLLRFESGNSFSPLALLDDDGVVDELDKVAFEGDKDESIFSSAPVVAPAKNGRGRGKGKADPPPGKKGAKLRLENVANTVRRCFPAQWSYAHNGIPGRVARILVGWNSQLLKVDVIHTSSQLLLTKVTMVDTRVFYASWVYGQNLSGDRRSLWGEMFSLASSIGTTPWIQLGDFNVVRRRSERVVGFDVGAAAEFNACIDSIDMDDMPSKGMWFTWSNKRGGLGDVKSKLDRTLIDSTWMDSFPDLFFSRIGERVHHAREELAFAREQCAKYPFDASLASMEKDLITDPGEVKKAILGYYEGLLGTPFAQKVDASQVLRLAVCQRVPRDMRMGLTIAVSREEIKNAMWSIRKDKAPGQSVDVKICRVC